MNKNDYKITKDIVNKAITDGIIKIIQHPYLEHGSAFMVGIDYGWYFENDNVVKLAKLDPEDFLKKAKHQDIVDDIYDDIVSRKTEDPDAYNYFLRLFNI